MLVFGHLVLAGEPLPLAGLCPVLLRDWLSCLWAHTPGAVCEKSWVLVLRCHPLTWKQSNVVRALGWCCLGLL